MNVFVDSSFLIALFHGKDNFHLKAKNIAKELDAKQAYSLTSNIALAEAVNFIYRLRGPKTAKKFLNLIKKTCIKEVFVTEEVSDKAFQLLFTQKSKKGLNLFDCLHLATMKSFSIDTILTFDKEFNKWVKVIGG